MNFAEYREHLTEKTAERKAERDDLQARFERRIVEAYREAFPKRKKRTSFADVSSTADGRELIERERLPFDEAAKKMLDEHDVARKAERDELIRLAELHEVVPCEDRYTIAHRASTYSYSTQTAPGTYARGQAERHADAFRALDIPVEVVWTPTGSYRGSGDYVVWAACDEDACVAVEMRPFDLVEAVAASWRRGCNPRVAWPFLPHDFEAKHGIDYQGRITR